MSTLSVSTIQSANSTSDLTIKAGTANSIVFYANGSVAMPMVTLSANTGTFTTLSSATANLVTITSNSSTITTLASTTANITNITTANLVATSISANGVSGVLGQILTSNGSAVYWGSSPTLAVNTTITANATLSASGNRIVSLNMTADAQSVTMPSATTLTLGTTIVFPNIGAKTAAIRDSSGVFLRAVIPGSSLTFYLRDNTSVAGLWTYDGADSEPAFASVDVPLPATMVAVSTFPLAGVTTPATQMSSTVWIAFGANSSGHLVAVAYDTSTSTFGTPVTVVAAATNGYGVIKISATKLLVNNIAASTLLHLNLSGTTITVSSTVAARFIQNQNLTNGNSTIAPPTFGASNDIIIAQVGTTAVIVPVDCSGVAPVLGTTTAITDGGLGITSIVVYKTSINTAVMCVRVAGATANYYNVLSSISASAVVANTAVAVSMSSGGTGSFITPLSNTLFAGVWYDSTNATLSSVAVAVSGTTVTASAVTTIEATATATIFTINPLTSTTAGLYYYSNNSVNNKAIILTLSATPTLSVGTPITVPPSVNASTPPIGWSGTTLFVSPSTATANYNTIFGIDFSGAIPFIINRTSHEWFNMMGGISNISIRYIQAGVFVLRSQQPTAQTFGYIFRIISGQIRYFGNAFRYYDFTVSGNPFETGATLSGHVVGAMGSTNRPRFAILEFAAA